MHFNYRLILVDNKKGTERSIVAHSVEELKAKIDMLFDEDFELMSSF